MIMAIVFILTLISGLIAVTGGNGLILMPALLLLDFNIKEVMVLIRISAVVFVTFNLFAMLNEQKMPTWNRKDLLITLVSSLSVVISIVLLNKLNDTLLMLIISIILLGLLLLVVFRPKSNHYSKLFILVLPIFAGVCGGTIGGAGLIISILYTFLGSDHKEAVQRRVVPSLIIQIISFLAFMSQGVHIKTDLLITVAVATAIAGFLNMKIFMKLSPRSGKILFYFGFAFSITNLLEKALNNIIN